MSLPSVGDDCQCYFSVEVLVEILHRLPIKSIFTFKCVSKRWLALLSDSSFVRRCINASSVTPPPWTLFYQFYSPESDSTLPVEQGMHLTSIAPPEIQSQFNAHDGFSLSFLPSPPKSLKFLASSNGHQPKSVRFLASSNGLVLCCATMEFQMLYCVCNPLTKQWVTLPQPPRCYIYVRIGFVCEVSSSPQSTRYKVIRMTECGRRSHILNLEIFSSETGEWMCSKVLCPNKVNLYPFYYHAVSYNGILHWLDRQNKILAFDPNHSKSDQCRFIDLPSDSEASNCSRECLGFSEGRLCFLRLTELRGVESYTLSVCVLKDYNGGEWCLEHKTAVTDMLAQDGVTIEGISKWMPLAFHPLNRNVVFLRCIDCIASYNIQSRRLEMVYPHNVFLTSWMVFPFVLPRWPTLLPPLS